MNDTFQIFQYSFIVGVLASISCGIVGSYVVARRITYIAGGIAHCVLGGIGAARYMRVVHHWDRFDPLYGALAAALLAAMVIGAVSLRAKEREDTAISAIWSVGMATGILFLWGTPGYNSADLQSYLFGSILTVSRSDMLLTGLLGIVVVVVALAFYQQFVAVCFDEEFSRVRNVKTNFYYLVLLALTALTVVLLLRVVGIVLVIALLTLPAAIAGHFSRTLWQMMGLAILFCAILTVSGVALSIKTDLPAGATIVVLSGAAYLVVTVGRGLARLLPRRKSVARPA